MRSVAQHRNTYPAVTARAKGQAGAVTFASGSEGEIAARAWSRGRESRMSETMSQRELLLARRRMRLHAPATASARVIGGT